MMLTEALLPRYFKYNENRQIKFLSLVSKVYTCTVLQGHKVVGNLHMHVFSWRKMNIDVSYKMHEIYTLSQVSDLSFDED